LRRCGHRCLSSIGRRSCWGFRRLMTQPCICQCFRGPYPMNSKNFLTHALPSSVCGLWLWRLVLLDSLEPQRASPRTARSPRAGTGAQLFCNQFGNSAPIIARSRRLSGDSPGRRRFSLVAPASASANHSKGVFFSNWNLFTVLRSRISILGPRDSIITSPEPSWLIKSSAQEKIWNCIFCIYFVYFVYCV